MSAGSPTDDVPPAAGQLLCFLFVPRALEERVVDWLLERQDATFAGVAIDWHGHDATELRGAEKVTGRQRRLQFQLLIPADERDAVLETLRTEFGGADVEYWLVPVVATGSLRR